MLKYVFDRTMAFAGLLVFWPVLLVVAILIKIRMPDGPVIFRQRPYHAVGACIAQIQTRRIARVVECPHRRHVLCRASSGCSRICRRP